MIEIFLPEYFIIKRVCVFTYRCKCGKIKGQHESRSNNQSEDEDEDDVEDGAEWDSTAHTRRLDATSYGGITFSYDSLMDGNWQLVSNDFSQVRNLYMYRMQRNIIFV